MESFLNYDGWKKYLEQGREFDFYYKNEKYSVSVSQIGTEPKLFLTKYGEADDSQEFDDAPALLGNGKIGGELFKDICHSFEIEMIY